MARTTYLLGAGASAGSLPTVDGFEEKLVILIRLFREYNNSNSPIPPESQNLLETAIKDLHFLVDGCRNHRSIDTFAKMLFLTDNKIGYHRVKCAIVLFFELCHFYFQETDKRYDAFLATILENDEGNLITPDHINILSWNYDYEFERAFMKYCKGLSDINLVSEHLNIVHRNRKGLKSVENKFGIIKINGTAGFYYDNDNDPENDNIILGLGIYDQKSTKKLTPVINNMRIKKFAQKTSYNEVLPLLNKYIEIGYDKSRKYRPAICFAWEIGENLSRVKREIQKAITGQKKTHTIWENYSQNLIVIGYSFPYFNRNMDKHIMLHFKKYTSSKIYVQDKFDRAQELIYSLKELGDFSQVQESNFIYKTDLTQFYMPGD